MTTFLGDCKSESPGELTLLGESNATGPQTEGHLEITGPTNTVLRKSFDSQTHFSHS